MSPLTELRAFLRSMLGEVRVRRDVRTQLDVEALQDIAAEATAEQRATAAIAFTARVADDEALRLLAKVTAPDSPGGRAITADELPDVVAATRHIRRSRDADHRLAERLAVPA